MRGKSNSAPLKGELVCSCSQVGEGNIKEAIGAGCTDFKKICAETGAGLGCGSCKPEVKALLDLELKMVTT